MVYSPSSGKKGRPIIAFKAFIILLLILWSWTAFADTPDFGSRQFYIRGCHSPTGLNSPNNFGVNDTCAVVLFNNGAINTSSAANNGGTTAINNLAEYYSTSGSEHRVVVQGLGYYCTDNTFTSCGGVNSGAAIYTDSDDFSSSLPIRDNDTGNIINANALNTRIIDFTPHSSTTPITNPVTFSLHAYVNPDDVGTFIGVKFTLHNIDQNVLLLSGLSPSDIYFLDGFEATTSGDYYFATTTTVGEGNYRINAQLTRSYLGGFFQNPFSSINQDLSHQFIVGSSTYIGNLSQNYQNELNDFIGNTTATSSAASAYTCNPLGTAFDTRLCITFLFYPTTVNNAMEQLKSNVLTHEPWGYFTRLVTIFSGNATSTIPTYTVHFQDGPGSDLTPNVDSISFDPGDMIAGAGSLLSSIHDPINSKTPQQILEPFVQLGLALSVLFTIVADLTGSHKHNQHQKGGKDNKKLS